jgi:hypothetical protein
MVTAAFKVCWVGWSFKAVLHFAKCNSNAGSPAFFPNREALNGVRLFRPFHLMEYTINLFAFSLQFALDFLGGNIEQG